MLSYASFEGSFHPHTKLVTIPLNPKQKLWRHIKKFVLICTPLKKALKDLENGGAFILQVGITY